MGQRDPFPDDSLTRFQVDTLAAVAANPGAPGKDVSKRLEREGYGEVYHGRLYPNLDALVEAGLVVKRERDGRTNAYEPTPEGRDLLERYGEFLAGVVRATTTLGEFEGPTRAEAREAVETAVEAGLAAPLCPSCHRRISVDEFNGDADPHDCPAAEEAEE